jgi:hypothetical protein
MKPDFSNFASFAGLRFQPTKGHLYADLADELAILDSRSGVYYGLDPVGARIWCLLTDWKTCAEIRDTLLTEYDVGRSRLESDLGNLLDELSSKGLIEIVPPGAKPPLKHEAVGSR